MFARPLLIIEAAAYLLLARLALRVLPYEWLAWFFIRPVRQPEMVGAERERSRKEVVWALRTMSRRLPGETVCFPRGIAAQAMLRRRGISTTLCYGAATLPDRGLTAHVWVMDGPEGVVGHYDAHRYRILVRYPEPSQ